MAPTWWDPMHCCGKRREKKALSFRKQSTHLFKVPHQIDELEKNVQEDAIIIQREDLKKILAEENVMQSFMKPILNGIQKMNRNSERWLASMPSTSSKQ